MKLFLEENKSLDEDIKIIQLHSLGILKELIKIFDEHNLTYYLSGGTLLGAVRHKGFIPWDDDIDISMPREDYENFLSISSETLDKRYFVQNFKTDNEYKYYITRVLDRNYDIEEIRTKKRTNPAVDILPLDGSPNNILARKVHFLKCMSLRYLISLCNRKIIDMKRRRNIIERILVNTLRFIPFERFLDEYKLKTLLDHSLKKYSMQSSDYSGCLMGAYRTKQMVPTEWFGENKVYQFENLNLSGPENFDCYLRQMYGDYMEVPKVKDITSKLHYRIIK